MNEQPDVQAVRFEVREGRLQVNLLPDCGTASDGAFGGWGSLYVVSHAVNRGLVAERVCERVEDVAVETYCRSAGGVTNRLRQAARNANKYLYLRNLVRGEEQALLAALACVAVRGTDAYACGIGPHSISVLNRGRVRTFQSHLAEQGPRSTDEWRSDGYLLGRKAKRSDPRFSYRQLLPGDLVLLAAGSDAESFRRAAAELAPTLDRYDIEVAARELAELMGQCGDGSALLIGVQMEPTSPADVCKTAQTGGPRLPYSGRSFFRTLRRPGRGQRAAQRQMLPKGKPTGSPPPDAEAGPRMRKIPSRNGRSFDSAAGQGGRVMDGGAGSQRILQGGVERCRLVVTLLGSLLLALRAGVLWILTSWVGVVRRCWRWIRRRRVLENLARGCRLALFGLWAGLKGLLIGILPERQGTTTTFAASARPMARARVLGFHPSGRSRAIIGALIILLVVALVGASAVRVKSRLEQADVEALASQVEESLKLSNEEDDREAKMAMLAEAQERIDEAPASQRGTPELQKLSGELEARRDGLTGVVRLPFAKDETPTSGVQAVGRIVVHQDSLYVVDALGQGLTIYALDQQGRISVDDEPLIWDSPTAGEAAEVQILDIEWVEAANGRLTPCLAALTSQGSLVEIDADGSTRSVAVAGTSEWQNPRAMATYAGNIYVLDPGNENILKYVPQGDDYQHPPINYVQDDVDIKWDSVVDMAIDGCVYLLLSDGSIVKLAGGQAQEFSQEGLYPGLENPTAIFASPESQSIFVAERSEGRVVEFSRDGQFVRQYKASADEFDPLPDMGAFTIDVVRGRVIVGTASGMFFTDLPSLQQASGG
jgi:hypothetical protein